MNLSLTAADWAALDRLEQTRRDNFRIAELYSRLLNLDPCTVKPALIQEITTENKVSNAYVYYAILASLFGLDEDANDGDAAFLHRYLAPSVKELYPFSYQNDPYLQTVRFSEQAQGLWRLTTMSYAPCEAFIFRDPTLLPDLTEIPMLGFFMQGFSYPAVLQGGREWMTVTPNEIETMRAPIERARGRVITFGLGLGYFAFMTARKDSVTSVTVVERDSTVIDLFTRHILPQLPCRHKITVIRADAFEMLRAMRDGDFDYGFADIWHDAGDGLPLYLTMKKEAARLATPIDYWIEPSILGRLRWMCFGEISPALKAGRLPDRFPEITSVDRVYRLLSDQGLRSLAASGYRPPLI